MRVTSGRILVVGLGRSGMAVADFLLGLRDGGAPITIHVADTADTPALQETAVGLARAGVEVCLGADTMEGQWGLVVASPGVPPSSPLLTSVSRGGTPVVTEVELAWAHSEAPFVAVTGTNGKTTTTRMIAHLLNTSGVVAEAVGNIGTPAISVAPSAGRDTVIVCEVSSFHLARIEEFRPAVSVLLNVTRDHVDWHGTMKRFTEAKARVFENQRGSDLAVVVVDDPGAAPFAECLAAQGVRVARVSLETLHPGGASLVSGVLILSLPEGEIALVSATELIVEGEHNITNALAASVAAFEMGADPTSIGRGLTSFAALEHRLEPVGHVDGVEYFNDSKATNPDAVAKALIAFEGRPVVLLLGGRNKGNRFDGLAASVTRVVRTVVAFGEASLDIERDLAGAVRIDTAVGLQEAVRLARRSARAGDVVLLSPACASQDEFTDYEERGRVFKRLVVEMASEPGVELND